MSDLYSSRDLRKSQRLRAGPDSDLGRNRGTSGSYTIITIHGKSPNLRFKLRLLYVIGTDDLHVYILYIAQFCYFLHFSKSIFHYYSFALRKSGVALKGHPGQFSPINTPPIA